MKAATIFRTGGEVHTTVETLCPFLIEINPRFKTTEFGLPPVDEGLESLPVPCTIGKDEGEELKDVVSSSLAFFNEGQCNVFDTIVGEILHRTSSKDPFASVHVSPEKEEKSRCFFFDAPRGT